MSLAEKYRQSSNVQANPSVFSGSKRTALGNVQVPTKQEVPGLSGGVPIGMKFGGATVTQKSLDVGYQGGLLKQSEVKTLPPEVQRQYAMPIVAEKYAQTPVIGEWFAASQGFQSGGIKLLKELGVDNKTLNDYSAFMDQIAQSHQTASMVGGLAAYGVPVYKFASPAANIIGGVKEKSASRIAGGLVEALLLKGGSEVIGGNLEKVGVNALEKLLPGVTKSEIISFANKLISKEMPVGSAFMVSNYFGSTSNPTLEGALEAAKEGAKAGFVFGGATMLGGRALGQKITSPMTAKEKAMGKPSSIINQYSQGSQEAINRLGEEIRAEKRAGIEKSVDQYRARFEELSKAKQTPFGGQVATQKPVFEAKPKEAMKPTEPTKLGEKSKPIVEKRATNYKKYSPASKATADAFEKSSNQVKVGDNFEIGTFGRNQVENKLGKADRFSINELPETTKNIKSVYKASNDPINYRSDNLVWRSEMPDGTTRAIYTRLNKNGVEEIINWHEVPKQNIPNYFSSLESFGIPTGSRTQILPLEGEASSPLTYRDKTNVSQKTPEVNNILKTNKAQEVKTVKPELKKKVEEVLRTPTKPTKLGERRPPVEFIPVKQPKVETKLGDKVAEPVVEKITEQKPTEPVKTEGTVLKSKVYDRLKNEIPENMREEVQYNKINLEKDADKAIEIINKDKNDAYDIATGRKAPPEGQTSTSINIAMAEKALEEGNHKLYADLVKNRSLAQTRRGQEIVAEKGSITDNSTARYVKELVSLKLDQLGSLTIKERLGKTSSKQKAIDKIDSEVKLMESKIKNKKLAMNDAFKLLDQLKCII